MVLGDEKISKKRKRGTSTNDLVVTKGDVKAVELDLSFKEEKLAFVETRKERDKTKMETKAPGESEDCDIKSKKERDGGTHSWKSIKDSCQNAIKNVVEKKIKLKNELSKFDALLDTKTIFPKTASKTCDTEVVETLGEGSGENVIDVVKRKRMKKEKRKKGDGQVDVVTGVNQGDVLTLEEIESEIADANIRKRKNTKQGHSSKDLMLEKSEKRVRFSGDIQVFPPSSDSSDEKQEVKDESLLRGKRFTREEDEIIKDAVYKYIEVHNLGEEGLQKVLDSRSHSLRGCWKKIAAALPYRPRFSVNQRAQKLFRMGERRKYTKEEREKIQKFHRQHGPKWKVLADELGRHDIHVYNAWKRIKLVNNKKGNWSQEEIQTLFDLVNTNLQLKLCEEKKSNHGMLRDNISWSAISDRLSTRAAHLCCNKWYRTLTSPLVATGEWADTDDYRLIDALFELDASCLEDVDWDCLLDYRPGELCRKRWNQMVRQLSKHENKSFAEQVEVLANRYRPDLVGAREAWDSKPAVP